MVRGPRTSSSLATASYSAETPSSPTSLSYSSRYSAVSSTQDMTTSSNASSILSQRQPQTPVDGDADSCSIDPDAWFAQFHDDADYIEVSDVLPTQSELEKAGNIPVYDHNGTSRPFKALFTGSENIGQRQLIIFVRHFYCLACQSYLKAITDTISPSRYFSLNTPTTITIIGCGAYRLIPKYSSMTTCPFRVFSDPTRKLYKALRMSWTTKIGHRPEYTPGVSAGRLVYDSFVQMYKNGAKDGLVGGPMTQIGGEFLFEDGAPIWCHRMTNVRNHTEMSTLRKVLEMDEEVAVVEEAKAVELSPTSPARGLRLVWDGGNQAHLGRDSTAFSDS